jgi:hypothetical protein
VTRHHAGPVGTTSCDARRSGSPGQRAANQITIAATIVTIFLTVVIGIATTLIITLG